MKTCNKCGKEKPLDAFHFRSRKDGTLRSNCKGCQKDSVAENYEQSREGRKSHMRSHYEKNKASILAQQADYRKANPAMVSAKGAKRRAAKIQQTPSWANDQLISAYYMEAKRLEELTGIKFHVDHIIPLQGELVSGLHVETNLQLLPANENQGKSNSFDPETFVA